MTELEQVEKCSLPSAPRTDGGDVSLCAPRQRAEHPELPWQAPAPAITLPVSLPVLFHRGFSSLSGSTPPRIVSPSNRKDQSTDSGYIFLPNPLCGSLGLLAVPSRINQAKPHQAHTFTSPAAPHLFEGQQHELLCLGHLHEVLEDVLVGRLEEVAAGVRVGKAPDPQAVGWVELAQEELAASIPHTIQLKQAGSGKKCLAVEKNGEKRSFQGKETPFSPSSHCRSMAEEV